MDAEAMVQRANTVLLFAQRALDLRSEATNYRALGKVQLADLLEQEADQNEESARDVLARHQGRSPARTVNVQLDGKAIRTELLKLKRRNGGRGLGLA